MRSVISSYSKKGGRVTATTVVWAEIEFENTLETLSTASDLT